MFTDDTAQSTQDNTVQNNLVNTSSTTLMSPMMRGLALMSLAGFIVLIVFVLRSYTLFVIKAIHFVRSNLEPMNVIDEACKPSEVPLFGI